MYYNNQQSCALQYSSTYQEEAVEGDQEGGQEGTFLEELAEVAAMAHYLFSLLIL